MNLHILAELHEEDARPYIDEIAVKGKSAVFKAMLLSFRVSIHDLLEHFEAVEWDTTKPDWETYEELGYVLAWNSRSGELIFGQKESI